MDKVSIILPYYNRKDLLKITLDSFEYFYKNRNDLEIVIVDDVSSEDQRLESLIKLYSLDINLIRLTKKEGINPCYPYNVGVKQSSGDITILSCPEIFHTTNIFDQTNNFNKINDNSYGLFSCFCLTMKEGLNECSSFNEVLDMINSMCPNFYLNLGENGYSYNNRYGSWYTHSKYRTSMLNFFSALTRKTYFEIGGFDERFRQGTGFDDDDFRDRLLRKIGIENVLWYDDVVSIHVDHATVSDNPTSNASKLKKVLKRPYDPTKRKWGEI